MRRFRDAKAMAKSLRETLGQRKVDISHSESLEIVAAQFALKDWNTLSAKIDENGAQAGQGQATPGGPQFKDAIPILRIFSVEKAKEFLRRLPGLHDRLGAPVSRQRSAV